VYVTGKNTEQTPFPTTSAVYGLTIRDLHASGGCGRAVLDFLSTTDVGRLVPAKEDAGSEAPEWEASEAEREGRGAAAGCGGAGLWR